MGEGGKEVERRPARWGGHLGTVFLHESAPFPLALRALCELDCSGAGGERRQPDVVEVLRGVLALSHAARRPPHRADAKALVRRSIGAELDNSDGHSEDQVGEPSLSPGRCPTPPPGNRARVPGWGGLRRTIKRSLPAPVPCRKGSLSFSGSPAKYICVTKRLLLPVTSK